MPVCLNRMLDNVIRTPRDLLTVLPLLRFAAHVYPREPTRVGIASK